MSAKQSEQAFASRLLPLNDAISSLDFGYALKVDGILFGAEMLTFGAECFADSITDATHPGPVAGIASRGKGDGKIFNDRQPIDLAA
jgi:hypothetical protein